MATFALALTCALASAAGVLATDNTAAGAGAEAATPASAAASTEGEGSDVLSSVKATIFDLPVVGAFLAGFEPTVYNIALVFAAVVIINLVVRRVLYPPDPNLPPFYNPGMPVLGALMILCFASSW